MILSDNGLVQILKEFHNCADGNLIRKFQLKIIQSPLPQYGRRWRTRKEKDYIQSYVQVRKIAGNVSSVMPVILSLVVDSNQRKENAMMIQLLAIIVEV